LLGNLTGFSTILYGGSGERQTLKIVAKYADACNLFGSIETIKRKLDVLKEHCKSVGRDYNSILKTKLDLVVIDDNEEIARKSAQQFYKGIPEQQIRDREFAIYGTPEDVLRQIELLEEAGIQYLIVHYKEEILILRIKVLFPNLKDKSSCFLYP
jgi:alkanesulfonate monooxygenase SsuD/methylene tetrahydromethanopterin reductase-like flavin-dependent oxidoreductase (luciferase family)